MKSVKKARKLVAASALLVVVAFTSGCLEICFLPCYLCFGGGGGDPSFAVPPPSSATQAKAVSEHVVENASAAATGSVKY